MTEIYALIYLKRGMTYIEDFLKTDPILKKSI